MSSAPSSIAALASALPVLDPARVEEKRRESDERPIDYALGSGEADEVGLYAGFKPLVRQLLSPEALPAVRARFESLGLVVELARHVEGEGGPAGAHVLFAGRDPRRVHAAARLEARPDHDVELGLLLGYPRCCIEAYLAVPPPRGNLDVARAAAARTRAASPGPGRFLPRLNVLDLGVFHYVSWLPCRFDCAPSRAYADAVAHHIARRHGQFVGASRSVAVAPASACPPGCRHQRFVARMDQALAAHRLLLDESAQLSLTGRHEDGTIHVERAWATARDRQQGRPPLTPETREALARLCALVEAAGAVTLDGPRLRVGGESVAELPGALLVPFGDAA